MPSLLIPFHPLAATIPLNNRMRDQGFVHKRQATHDNVPNNFRARGSGPPSLRTGRLGHRIECEAHKWDPLPAVCACMQCSTWAREAQAPRLRACTTRHRLAHTKRLIVMDLFGMQTRGSDRSFFLFHVLIGSYEVTSLVERGSSSSTKTHRSKPVSRHTNTGR